MGSALKSCELSPKPPASKSAVQSACANRAPVGRRLFVVKSEVVSYSFTRRKRPGTIVGRATGFGGIHGNAATCPSRFCDRKPLIWACRLAADRFVDLLSDRCHGRYVSSRYGIKSVTACVVDVVCRVLCCPYQTNGLLPARYIGSRARRTGKLRASGGHEGLITNR